MTSSIKPEMRNVSQPCQRRIEPLPYVGEDRTCSFKDVIEDKNIDTHRETDTLITILRSRIGAKKLAPYSIAERRVPELIPVLAVSLQVT